MTKEGKIVRRESMPIKYTKQVIIGSTRDAKEYCKEYFACINGDLSLKMGPEACETGK